MSSAVDAPRRFELCTGFTAAMCSFAAVLSAGLQFLVTRRSMLMQTCSEQPRRTQTCSNAPVQCGLCAVCCLCKD